MYKNSSRMFCVITAVMILMTLIPIGFTVYADTATVTYNTAANIADTFTGDTGSGIQATPQGSQDSIYLRTSGNNTRYGYYKLDCSELSGLEITDAKFKIYYREMISGSSYHVSSGDIKVSVFPDTSWNPAAVTWNAPPNEAGISDVTTFSITPDVPDVTDARGIGWYTIDLTNVLQNDLDKIISLKLAITGNYNGSANGERYNFVTIEGGAKTGTYNGKGPSLEVTYEKSALVTGVTVSPSTLSIYEESEPVQLTANVAPPDADNRTVTWSSNNTDAATVDPDTGLVTPVAEGTATITATSTDGSNVSGSCAVTVVGIAGSDEVPITLDTFVNSAYNTQTPHSELYIDARKSPSGQERAGYLKVDASSVISDRMIAEARLYMNYIEPTNPPADPATNGGSLPVIGLADTSFNITGVSWNARPSETGAVSCGNLAIGADFNQYYSVDVTPYVTKRDDGVFAFKITGDDANREKMYRFSSSETGETTAPYLKVLYKKNDNPVTGITLDKTSETAALARGAFKLTPTLTAQDTFNAPSDTRVAWSSSDSSVATVSQAGVVTPVGLGRSTITASAKGAETLGTVTAMCEIRVIEDGGRITVSEDTFIDQNATGTNYGAHQYLYSRRVTDGGTQNRLTFLKVDLSQTYRDYGAVSRAELNLYYYDDGQGSALNGGTLPVCYVDSMRETSNNWQEGAVTWQSAKDANIYPDATNPDAYLDKVNLSLPKGGFDNYYSVDITDFVKKDTDKVMTFIILGNIDTAERFLFRSKEYNSGQFAPFVYWEADLADCTYTYEDNGNTGDWAEGGSVEAEMWVLNDLLQDVDSAVMMFAIYTADTRRLVRFSASDETPKSDDGTNKTIFKAEITDLPANKVEYIMETFVWDSMNGMVPLYP